MDESKATPKAVVLSAILHVGIVGFLFLAILPCSSYENFFNVLHLPAWMNPIRCSAPLQLQGPIIQAVLIGPTGSPPPKSVKTKPIPNTVPPPPAVTPPTPPTPEDTAGENAAATTGSSGCGGSGACGRGRPAEGR
jgi:colicin import membrane protein